MLQHLEGMHAPAAVPGEQLDNESLILGPHMARSLTGLPVGQQTFPVLGGVAV